MDAVKYQKDKTRMTHGCRIPCNSCRLGYDKNGVDKACRIFELEHPEKAVEIVEAWAAEHPPKTKQSEFLRMFPDARIREDVIDIGPCCIENNKYPVSTCKTNCTTCRREYWSQEVE